MSRKLHLREVFRTRTSNRVPCMCSHNKLEVLPKSLAALTALRALLVSENRLCSMEAAAALSSLQRFECSGNILTALPPSLGHGQPDLHTVQCMLRHAEELGINGEA